LFIADTLELITGKRPTPDQIRVASNGGNDGKVAEKYPSPIADVCE